jgi:hypothetical protein
MQSMARSSSRSNFWQVYQTPNEPMTSVLGVAFGQASSTFFIKHAARESNLSFPTASATIKRLTGAGNPLTVKWKA